jgi:hypothetical protein
MDKVTTDCGALAKAIVFLNHFKGMPDIRESGKVMYPLEEVLLLALLAVLAGAELFVDIARFGCMKLDLLRRFGRFSSMARLRTIILATSSPPSTRSTSSAVSWRGLHR